MIHFSVVCFFIHFWIFALRRTNNHRGSIAVNITENAEITTQQSTAQMSKQFIATATAGRAHEADIYAVAVTKPFTITASGDGSLKLWSNAISETDRAKDFVKSVFVHKTGLHHVDAFQDVTSRGERLITVATTSFSGDLFFYAIDTNGDATPLDISLKDGSYWAIKWLKDHLGQRHRFAATLSNGSTLIYDLNWQENTNTPVFTKHGEIKAHTTGFATCLDLNSEQNLLATGFQNGDVVLTQLETAKPVYTFRNFGLKGSLQSSSSVRSVRFSPLGSILAIASDSGSYGTVTLYDTTYGENVGSLTIPGHSTSVNVGAYAHENWVFDLDFNESGDSIVTAGYDGLVRIWNLETRERAATLNLSPTDVDDEDIVDEEDGKCPAIGVRFINKGVRGGAGGDSNDGLVVISLDRGVRWYREAGGI